MSVCGACAPALSIERIVVRADRVVCDVAMAPGAPRCTSPQLMDRVRAAHPHVAHHACVNGRGETFAAVMDATSLPHLLEHLVIDLQTQAAADRDAVFVGTTEWTDEPAGKARVEVSFIDDLAALRAFRDAVAFLNAEIGRRRTLRACPSKAASAEPDHGAARTGGRGPAGESAGNETAAKGNKIIERSCFPS